MGNDAGWKQFERRVARLLAGGDPAIRRRGPDVSDADGGKTDIVHPGFGVECKLLARSGHADILEAVRQAERNSKGTQTPIAIVKRKRDLDRDSLVCMSLGTWLQWYGPSQPSAEPVHHQAVTVKMPASYCPNCGSSLTPRSCKMECQTNGCGYFLSCSDLEHAG